MSRLVVTGVQVGGIQPRLEINNFVRDDKQFSLYVQAWNKMQVDSQDNLQSFYQVGGIHGHPYIPWDGAGSTQVSPSWGGYCTHGSVLFPTWHRPYVAVIEQILSGYARQIASNYSVDRITWEQAAESFRFPYWDWAQNSVPPPEVISLDVVDITAPNGTRITVSNPLRRYTFHPVNTSFPFPYNQWPTTLRQPDSLNADATDDVPKLRSILQSEQTSITSRTYNMLTRINNWAMFSNHNADGGSLEAIHDSIHVYVGGMGDMAQTTVAGFDPIFFLHHCNVDRMLALWSAINIGQWVTPGNVPSGTFTLPPGAPVDTETGLTPFFADQSSFWPSAGLTNTASLGYTYPEFVGQDTGNPVALRAAILAQVNKLYGETCLRALTALPPGNGTNAGQFREWTSRVRFNNLEVQRSFSIIFFLGSVPVDPRQWLVDPGNIGSAHAFTSGISDLPQNDVKLQEGLVLLNEGIARLSGLSSFDPSEVGPYLKENLHWRVLPTDGTPVQLPSLEVTVLEVLVSLPLGAEFPVAEDPIEHGDITEGRSG